MEDSADLSGICFGSEGISSVVKKYENHGLYFRGWNLLSTSVRICVVGSEVDPMSPIGVRMIRRPNYRREFLASRPRHVVL